MKCPSSCQPLTISTACGYGRAEAIASSECVSATQTRSCSSRRRVMPQLNWRSHGGAMPKRRLAAADSRGQEGGGGGARAVAGGLGGAGPRVRGVGGGGGGGRGG